MGSPQSCQKQDREATSEYLATPNVNGAEENIVRMNYAAARGDVTAIKELLQAGAFVNGADYDRRSPLHVAAAEGQSKVVELLVTRKADVNYLDRWGHSALDEAASEDVRKVLEAAGARKQLQPVVEQPRRGLGPQAGSASRVLSPEGAEEVGEALHLCFAAAAGNTNILQELVQTRGADVSSADYDGRTALHVAAAQGHLATIQWLLDKRADPQLRDAFGLTPLAEATRHRHEAATKLLIGGGGAMAADSAAIKLASQTEEWAIPADEVTLENILSSTMKSVVYMATWRGTKVVAKMVKDEQLRRSVSKQNLGQNSEDAQRAMEEMHHEIMLLSRLRHPDLVLFMGACVDSSPPFFVIEFMEGGDLQRYYNHKAEKLGQRYKPPWSTLIGWSSACARALCFLHNCTRPIIHRDLKPLNLLLTSSLNLKVTDFGISKLMAPKIGGTEPQDVEPQMSGGVGTWRYMAPEVVRSEQYTETADIYSFALILYFMATGAQPFVDQYGKDAELILKDYLKGAEPRPTLSSSVSRQSMRDLMKDAWHVTPSKRPSAQECTQRLAKMSTEGSGGLGLRR